MIRKPIQTINASDIQVLITNGESECRTLDYKAEPPEPRNNDERERTLKSFSSLANTVGGDIIFGIKEEIDSKGIHTGIPDPKQPVGITRFNASADEAVRHIDQMIQHGIAPRIPGIQHIVISKEEMPSSVGPVIIFRIPVSPLRPHMIQFHGDKGNPRFYSRGGANNNPMDVQELRDAFLASESRIDKIRKFRLRRLSLMKRGKIVDGIRQDPTIAIHSIPFSAFDNMFIIDPAWLRDEGLKCLSYSGPCLPPFSFGADQRFNLDGFMI